MNEADLLPAALNAIHEAHGTPSTVCPWLNRLLREYPDASRRGLMWLLAEHEAGEPTHLAACKQYA
jgi:hypothetical protein